MTMQPTLDPMVLTRRVQELMQTGRSEAARPMLSALRRLAQPSPRIVELEARMLLAEAMLPEAIAVLDRGIAEMPGDAALLLCRAEAQMLAGTYAPAAQDAAGALLLEPGNSKAKAILGIVLIELGALEDATACLAEAVRAEPGCAAYRQALAEAQERQGDVDAAWRTMEAGIAAAPANIRLRTAAIMIAMRQRHFADVVDLAEAARSAGLADACVFGLLGHALSNMGRHAEAAEAYAEAAKLAPEDPYIRHLVRAAGVLPSAARAPAEYIETVFDGYADRFEDHLLGLGYRIPGLIRAALLEQMDLPRPDGAPFGPVLDLGCGTGLLGVVLSDCNLAPLVGLDLSGQMLQHAAAKGVYHELVRADLDGFLADADRRWRMILAADVFCYFGALEASFAAAHARLEQGGLFVLTVEALLDSEAGAAGMGWQLRSQGRYVHRQDYAEQAARQAGFEIVASRVETLRFEAETGVSGTLLVLRRTAAHA